MERRRASNLCPLCPTQPHFSKLMRRKWLSSSEALDGIVGTLGAKALALRRMQDEPYQVRLLGRGRGAGWNPGGRGARAEGSQSARLGETSSRWGATLSGRDRWRSIWGLRRGCPRVSGCSGGGGCRQGWGLWEVELRRKPERAGMGHPLGAGPSG